jgi:hypothetical protein
VAVVDGAVFIAVAVLSVIGARCTARLVRRPTRSPEEPVSAD